MSDQELKPDPPSNFPSDFPPHLKKLKSLEKIIGRGTYGSVHLTTSPDRVCKKFMVPSDDDGCTSDFLREVSALSALRDCPNIVELSHIDFSQGTSIYLKRYRTDLKKVLDALPKNPVSPQTICSLIFQILNGIYHAHLCGISHRDLKPNNILIDRENKLAICDWGLSRQMPTSAPDCFTEEVQTLWYRAPEILLGGKYTSAVDVWSVGIILCELINQQHLFKTKTERQQLDAIFDTFGTPDPKTWSGVDKFPHYPNFCRQAPPLSEIVKTDNLICLDLLRKLLNLNPNKRISVFEAINHPYFDSLRGGVLIAPSYVIQSLIKLHRKPLSVDFLKSQPQITNQSRTQAIKVINSIAMNHHTEYDLRYQLFFLACQYLDLFLSARVVDLKKLNLVAVVCIWIASKIIDVEKLEIQDLEFIYSLSHAQVMAAERIIIKQLNYHLYLPTEYTYLTLLQQQFPTRVTTRHHRQACRFLSAYVYDSASRIFAPYHLALMIYAKVKEYSKFEMTPLFNLISMTKTEYDQIKHYLDKFDHFDP